MDPTGSRHTHLPLRAALPAVILSLVAIASLTAASPAAAAPPAPLPNPDRPAVTPVAAGAAASAGPSCRELRRIARSGNRRAGLVVKDTKTGRTLCSMNPAADLTLASNTKLFTTTTVLGRLGPERRFVTRVFPSGRIRNGVLRGDLYLKGGGDPTLGTSAFLDAYLGGAGSAIEKLASKVERAGIERVTGRLYGDDTIFDRVRGVADSGFATSPWIGPLSGLAFNAGFTDATFARFSSDPARLATRTLARELRERGIDVKRRVGIRRTPPASRERRPLARVFSPDMAWMARTTNLDSNNFFAEMLLKNIGAVVRRSGTTAAGTKVVRGYTMGTFGAKVSPVDGSGLTVTNRSSAGDIVRLLNRARFQSWFGAFHGSLPIAGREGTLADRMRGSAAEGRCRAKTGTLTGASALSGYCDRRNGHRIAFSILMNGVFDITSARTAQDRIAASIARG
jgi:D-alanyl-D-alanine carboxypeptidase/D-alanyl-D-alanine-endopeptidase (penicillin-binding protein 4)